MMFLKDVANSQDKEYLRTLVGARLQTFPSTSLAPDKTPFYAASVDWNNLSRLNGEFGGRDVHMYLTHTNLIISEIKETLTAIVEGDAVEVIDGLLDIYWELAPVHNFFQPMREFLELMEMHYVPAVLHTPPVFAFLAFCDNFLQWYLAVPSVRLEDTIRLIGNFLIVTVRLIEHLLHREELRDAYTEVIFSNFSKFIPLSEEDSHELESRDFSTTLMREAQEQLGEEGDWAICFSTEGEELPFGFITLDGKIKKPSNFLPPALFEVLTVETLDRIIELTSEESKRAYEILENIPPYVQ